MCVVPFAALPLLTSVIDQQAISLQDDNSFDESSRALNHHVRRSVLYLCLKYLTLTNTSRDWWLVCA